MFDIGWSELLIIGSLALIVVGPKDLPGMLRTLGQVVSKARRMARDFQRTMEDAADGSDFKDLREMQKSMTDWNRKIGTGAPRKYAEKVLNGEDKPKSSKTPAPGSLDAADEAANAQWEAEKAAAEAKAAASAAQAETAPPPAPAAAPAPTPAPMPGPDAKGSV